MYYRSKCINAVIIVKKYLAKYKLLRNNIFVVLFKYDNMKKRSLHDTIFHRNNFHFEYASYQESNKVPLTGHKLF